MNADTQPAAVTTALYVIEKIVGPIEPIGDSRVDDDRLRNLEVLCAVTGELVERIGSVAAAADEHLASVKKAKGTASEFLATPQEAASGAVQVQEVALDAARLWLWKNFVDGKPEYWAFDNPYPCETVHGDPLTLGQPCGWAILKPSVNGRPHLPESEVIATAIRFAAPPLAGDRKQEPAQPVAHVCDDFTLRWAGSGPIAPIVEKHGLRVGSPLYAAAQPSVVDAAWVVENLLWDEHLECCGCPVEDTGGEYMGQRETVMSCCGNPEPGLLNAEQIVATLRAKFPRTHLSTALAGAERGNL